MDTQRADTATSATMMLDGLDTLSHVALGDLCFEPYNPPVSVSANIGRTFSESGDDNLNTPITTNTEASFSFLDEISQEALPITGRFSSVYIHNIACVCKAQLYYVAVCLCNALWPSTGPSCVLLLAMSHDPHWNVAKSAGLVCNQFT